MTTPRTLSRNRTALAWCFPIQNGLLCGIDCVLTGHPRIERRERRRQHRSSMLLAVECGAYSLIQIFPRDQRKRLPARGHSRPRSHECAHCWMIAGVAQRLRRAKCDGRPSLRIQKDAVIANSEQARQLRVARVTASAQRRSMTFTAGNSAEWRHRYSISARASTMLLSVWVASSISAPTAARSSATVNGRIRSSACSSSRCSRRVWSRCPSVFPVHRRNA